MSNGGYKNLGAVSFSNCNGYNNAVKILNDICLNLFSNNELSAVARSINVDDIEDVINKDIWSPESYKTKKTNCYTYSGRKEYIVTKCYPVIFSEEQYSSIDGVYKEEGLKRSEQDSLFGASKTYLKAENSLNPLQTAWTKNKLSAKNFINEKYYDLIFKEDNSDKKDDLMSYFLASRAVNLNENNVQFDIFEVSMGSSIKTSTLFNSLGGSIEYWDRIRPMVEISMECINIDNSSDGLTKDTSWKIEKR